MMNWIKEPWPWYIAGPMITLVMSLLIYFGKRFGVSSTMQTLCAMGGAGKYSDYFKINWKNQTWNITFVVGSLIGGWIASEFLMAGDAIALNPKTKMALLQLGILNPGKHYLPDLFSFDNLLTFKGFVFMVVGGFLVGFGTRYAGGCTSGHAISGLSNLQLPSLIAVIGFFIGGLIVTHFIIPIIL